MIKYLLAGAAAALMIPTGMAHASDTTVVGPGTTIFPSVPLPCTIAAVGHNDAGENVALTAGHCWVSSPNVYNRDGRYIGRFTQRAAQWGNLQDDWALITLDPGVTEGWFTPDGQLISSIGTDPQPGQGLTKFGQTTRTTTGTVTALDGNVIHASTIAFNGDSGGPAYQGSALVGLVSAMDTSPQTLSAGGGTLFSGIDGIMADIAQHGGFHL